VGLIPLQLVLTVEDTIKRTFLIADEAPCGFHRFQEVSVDRIELPLNALLQRLRYEPKDAVGGVFHSKVRYS
jgi:hypothetical protein